MSTMRAEDVEIVEKAVRGTLEQLEKNAPEEFSKLKADPAKEKAVTEAARAAATEQVKLAREFVDQPSDIAERLAKHLPESRIKIIRGGFDFQTFRMDISKKSDGKHWVEFTLEAGKIEPKALLGAVDIDWSKLKQYASVLVEAIALVMSAVGISASPSSKAVNKAIDEAAEAIKSSTKLQRALDEFVKAWNSAGGSAYKKAKAIFFLIKDSYAGGILWTVIKAICSEMAWYDWVLTSAKVTAMIIAALATDGAALIAEIALIVLDAVAFARKIANLVQLEAIKAAT